MSDLCAKCGGLCCQQCPGLTVPSDFKDNDAILAAIKSGRWCLDWYEADGTFEQGDVYFVRPSIKGREGKTRHAAWGGECTFLGPDGCTSGIKPHQCRTLVARPGMLCRHDDARFEGKAYYAEAWLGMQDFLEEIK